MRLSRSRPPAAAWPLGVPTSRRRAHERCDMLEVDLPFRRSNPACRVKHAAAENHVKVHRPLALWVGQRLELERWAKQLRQRINLGPVRSRRAVADGHTMRARLHFLDLEPRTCHTY